MNQKNEQGKRTARERMQEERRRQEARERRKRGLTVLGAAVAVLGIAAAIGIVVANRGGGPGKPVAAPSGALGGQSLVIPVGKPDAPSTLTVYEDFRCPACGQFEARFHPTVNKLVALGKAKVEYHVVSFIDDNVPGNGSKYAANAAACAQSRGKFAEYHDVLYANQPPETNDAFGAKARLIALAQKVDGLRGNRAFETCVKDGTYDGWVKKSQAAFAESGYSSTPTVLLNGNNVFADQRHPLTPKQLVARVEAANKGKRPGTAAPSGSRSEKSSPEPSASLSR